MLFFTFTSYLYFKGLLLKFAILADTNLVHPSRLHPESSPSELSAPSLSNACFLRPAYSPLCYAVWFSHLSQLPFCCLCKVPVSPLPALLLDISLLHFLSDIVKVGLGFLFSVMRLLPWLTGKATAPDSGGEHPQGMTELFQKKPARANILWIVFLISSPEIHLIFHRFPGGARKMRST